VTSSLHRVLDHHPSEDHDPRSVENFHVARFVSDVPTKGSYLLSRGEAGVPVNRKLVAA